MIQCPSGDQAGASELPSPRGYPGVGAIAEVVDQHFIFPVYAGVVGHRGSIRAQGRIAAEVPLRADFAKSRPIASHEVDLRCARAIGGEGQECPSSIPGWFSVVPATFRQAADLTAGESPQPSGRTAPSGHSGRRQAGGHPETRPVKAGSLNVPVPAGRGERAALRPAAGPRSREDHPCRSRRPADHRQRWRAIA